MSKQKTAEHRSNHSVESATEDKRSRHERCRIEVELQPSEASLHTPKKCRIASKAITFPQVPSGLQPATLDDRLDDMHYWPIHYIVNNKSFLAKTRHHFSEPKLSNQGRKIIIFGLSQMFYNFC